MSWGPAAAYPWRQVRSAPPGTQRAGSKGMDGRMHWYRYRLELLECGHRLRLPPRSAKADRRRCRQCPATTVDIKGRRHVPTVRLGRWTYTRSAHHNTMLVGVYHDREPLVLFSSYTVPEL